MGPMSYGPYGFHGPAGPGRRHCGPGRRRGCVGPWGRRMMGAGCPPWYSYGPFGFGWGPGAGRHFGGHCGPYRPWRFGFPPIPLMMMWFAHHYPRFLSGNDSEEEFEEESEVQKAEKPEVTGQNDQDKDKECAGKKCFPGPFWQRFGGKPDCWIHVVQLKSGVKKDSAKVTVEDRVLTVRAPHKDQKAGDDGESGELNYTLTIPDDVMVRSLRTTWLGPRRLMVFALRRRSGPPKEKPETDTKKEMPEIEEGPCKGMRPWFKMVFLPGFKADHVTTLMKDGEVKVHALKEEGDDKTGYDSHEVTRVFALPDDIKEKTVRLAMLGAHGPTRVCVFGLRRRQQGKKAAAGKNKRQEDNPETSDCELENDNQESDTVQVSEQPLLLQKTGEQVLLQSAVHEEVNNTTDDDDDNDDDDDDKSEADESDEDDDEEWVKPTVTQSVAPQPFSVELDVSKYSPDEVSVKLRNRTLQVSARHQDEEEEHQFQRRYNIGEGVDVSKLSCSLNAEKGLLQVTAPPMCGEEVERPIAIDI